MKILRLPNVPSPFLTEHRCGATLEISPGDIQSRGSDRDGSYVIMRCAHCRDEMMISTLALPHDWK